MVMKKISLRKTFFVLLILLLLGVAAVVLMPRSLRTIGWNYTLGRFFRYSDADRLHQFGQAALTRLGLGKAPEAVRLLVFKEEKRLEAYGRFASEATWQLLKSYPVIAASGGPGPKLREGDRQVPEGAYAIESLHPNSAFYLALRVEYPSPEDIAMARQDSRPVENLGGNIMIHGKGGSVGCIAMSDEDMEEIFALAGYCGPEAVELFIAPYDFRVRPLPEPDAAQPTWLPGRYKTLQQLMVETSRHSQ